LENSSQWTFQKNIFEIFSFFATGLKNFKAPFRKKIFRKFLKLPKFSKIKFYENFRLYSKFRVCYSIQVQNIITNKILKYINVVFTVLCNFMPCGRDHCCLYHACSCRQKMIMQTLLQSFGFSKILSSILTPIIWR